MMADNSRYVNFNESNILQVSSYHCGSCIPIPVGIKLQVFPFTRANAQWVIHGFK